MRISLIEQSLGFSDQQNFSIWIQNQRVVAFLRLGMVAQWYMAHSHRVWVARWSRVQAVRANDTSRTWFFFRNPTVVHQSTKAVVAMTLWSIPGFKTIGPRVHIAQGLLCLVDAPLLSPFFSRKKVVAFLFFLGEKESPRPCSSDADGVLLVSVYYEPMCCCERRKYYFLLLWPFRSLIKCSSMSDHKKTIKIKINK